MVSFTDALLNELLINKYRYFSCSDTSSSSQPSVREPVMTQALAARVWQVCEANCEVFVTVVGKYLIAAQLPLSGRAVVYYDSHGSTSLVLRGVLIPDNRRVLTPLPLSHGFSDRFVDVRSALSRGKATGTWSWLLRTGTEVKKAWSFAASCHGASGSNVWYCLQSVHYNFNL